MPLPSNGVEMILLEGCGRLLIGLIAVVVVIGILIGMAVS